MRNLYPHAEGAVIQSCGDDQRRWEKLANLRVGQKDLLRQDVMTPQRWKFLILLTHARARIRYDGTTALQSIVERQRIKNSLAVSEDRAQRAGNGGQSLGLHSAQSLLRYRPQACALRGILGVFLQDREERRRPWASEGTVAVLDVTVDDLSLCVYIYIYIYIYIYLCACVHIYIRRLFSRHPLELG